MGFRGQGMNFDMDRKKLLKAMSKDIENMKKDIDQAVARCKRELSEELSKIEEYPRESIWTRIKKLFRRN